MLARIKSSSISGLDAAPIEVEVRVADAKENFTIIGLGDGAVREAKDRVRSALRACGFDLPKMVLVNLAPAELKKEGSSFDVAIAIGILVASEQISTPPLKRTTFHGELALDGRVKPVRGAVALAIRALQSNIENLFVPLQNAAEASLIGGLRIFPVSSLRDIVNFLREDHPSPPIPESVVSSLPQMERSLSDVWGQTTAKRAMVVAAAGAHNLLMIGPPGCGKSMMAERFSTILPPLERHEILEVAKIHSIGGLPIDRALGGERPYRAPHHLISDAGLVGGGSVPRPGEISLAHHGVLFLDEFPEYRRSAIESLRSPLETGQVNIARARGSWVFPARFQLIAAMNPCPCGRLGARGQHCLCSKGAVQAYLRKISQPILERIDLHVQLEAVPVEAMTAVSPTGDSFDAIVESKRILMARELQNSRLGRANGLARGEEVKKFEVAPSALRLLERVSSKGAISARGFTRVLKVARTIADLEQCLHVEEGHVAEALSFRSLDMIERYCAAA